MATAILHELEFVITEYEVKVESPGRVDLMKIKGHGMLISEEGYLVIWSCENGVERWSQAIFKTWSHVIKMTLEGEVTTSEGHPSNTEGDVE